MKLEIEDIKLRVDRTESEMATPRKLMRQWQKMLDLDPGFKEMGTDTATRFGKEQVITPDPLNVVNKAVQLFPPGPKIDIPTNAKEQESRESAEKRELFLTAMYPRINAQGGENFMQALARMLLARGIAYAEVLWIRDQLPKKLRKRMFPFSVRKLDPLEVGLHRGPYYVEYAYHKYIMQKVDARQKYPDLEMWNKPPRDKNGRYRQESDEVDVIDYWHVEPESGDVWHCLIVDDEFQIKPVKTNYPFVPIIEANGENGLSILRAIDGLWQYKCRLTSSIATGVLWATFPFFAVSNDDGMVVQDIEVRPMATVNVPPKTRFDQIKPEVNLNVLNAMLAQVDAGIQQSTFPAVLYGDAGNMQAGYGVNILSQHAGGRIDPFRNSLERCLQDIHHLMLAMIEEMDDDDEGVELYGTDDITGKPYRLCLKKDDIQGDYENVVTLKPNVPQDDLQKVTMGMQMVEKKIISKEHYRDKYLSIPSPSNESDRIAIEMAYEQPELQKKMAVVKFIEAYPETWPAILEGTPLLEIANKINLRAMGLSVPPMLEEMIMEAEMRENPLPPGPPPMPPGGSMQPPGISGAMGGGMPAALSGQVEPENLGLPPRGAPAEFAAIMGQPLSPMDNLRALDPML
jgi:hypothetical protein